MLVSIIYPLTDGKHSCLQNQSLLASSLQTAYNLRVLPDLVNNLVSDLADAVEGRIRYAFDLSRLAKEVLPKGMI